MYFALPLIWIVATQTTDAAFTLVQGAPFHCAVGAGDCSTSVSCPYGTVLWGGGVLGDQVKLESTYPSPFNDKWIVAFRGAFSEYGQAAHAVATPYAICGEQLPEGFSSTSTQLTPCPSALAPCAVEAFCPFENQTGLNGGIFGIQSEVESSVPGGNNPSAVWYTSRYPDIEDFGDNAQGDAMVYMNCFDAQAFTYTIITPSAPFACDHDGPSCSATADCPEGMVLIGGGFFGNQSKLESSGPISTTTWFASWYPATAEYGPGAAGEGTPVAMCAPGQELIFVDPIFANAFDSP